MKTKPRILVLRGGAIGDFILTLPAIRALRRRWPDAHLEIIGYPHIADLALADGFVDCVISLDKAEMARFFSPNPAIPEAQAETIRSFDLIVSYLYDPDETVRRNLLSVGARQVVYRSPKVEQVHAVDHLFKALEELAIYPEGVEYPVLELKADHRGKGRERIARFGRDVVALHPGSGSPRKNWPLDRFVVLAERLKNRAFSPVFTLGEADAEIAFALKQNGSMVPVLPTGTLVELAESFSSCVGYVGNDSGVTHLAASLGIPVVALFGPTDPALWAPRGPRVSMIQAAEPTTEGLASVPVETVFARAMTAIRP